VINAEERAREVLLLSDAVAPDMVTLGAVQLSSEVMIAFNSVPVNWV
jgi:hypothetical protein